MAPEAAKERTPAEVAAYNEGLEAAARHCIEVAELALRVRETDCTPEARLYQWRANDIRAMKIPT